MKRTAAFIGALALAATAWTAGTAHAAPSSHAGVRQTSVSATQQSAAERFWTPERLRAAKDVTNLPAATGTTGARTTAAPDRTGPEVAVAPVAAPGTTTTSGGKVTPMSSPTAWNGGGLISTTAGKVFFQNSSGGTFACSATVANADNKSVVLTAGH